jgi:hypothetical protein
VVGNLLLSDEIAIDAPGLIGAVVLAIVAVLVVRIADRRQAAEAHVDTTTTTTTVVESTEVDTNDD